MDEDRKKAITDFQMPTCQREMQSFLGAALFFKSFVPNYSGIAAELNKMTHKDFCCGSAKHGFTTTLVILRI